MIEHVYATRYVTPLREGGSLPGVVEANDFGTYVMKFRGAGQGLKALVAEVVVGELGRRLGLRVPELTAITLDSAIGKYEADQEVQDLLTASVGLNLGVDFLPGSFGWDSSYAVDEEEGARILWLDAFTANIDRSWRNPNVLIWHKQLWLIDHGAALYFHHGWSRGLSSPQRFAEQPYDATDHIMIGHASHLAAADDHCSKTISRELLADVLAQVPDEWLEPVPAGGVEVGLSGPAEVRLAYVEHLIARLENRGRWLPKGQAA
ncbi:HipA family kinase [Jatrophihabitans sp. DSM 45814]